MPNGNIHKLAGAITGVGASLLDKEQYNHAISNPVTSGIIGMYLGRLPDILEPAFHPNHRQFFHSWMFLGKVIYGTKKIYDWEPQTPFEQILRSTLLVAGTVYAGHLILDSLTKKSLPIIGKI